ncbi:MAG: ATP-binding cassette domain-containing protein, partial [Anaerolineales bacterium]
WGDYQGEFTLGKEAVSLQKLSQDELRRQISSVPQNPDLFQNTLLANISLGTPDLSRDEVMKAASLARLDSLIDQLPEGLDTWLGEKGSRFSAGEGQRIAIARAILRNAPLFLLDEPTANLDPITERELLGNLFEFLAGKTTLLITHRLVGLEQADRILVLDKGKIREQGTEEELLKNKDLYYQMWTTQNRILNYS